MRLYQLQMALLIPDNSLLCFLLIKKKVLFLQTRHLSSGISNAIQYCVYIWWILMGATTFFRRVKIPVRKHFSVPRWTRRRCRARPRDRPRSSSASGEPPGWSRRRGRCRASGTAVSSRSFWQTTMTSSSTGRKTSPMTLTTFCGDSSSSSSSTSTSASSLPLNVDRSQLQICMSCCWMFKMQPSLFTYK